MSNRQWDGHPGSGAPQGGHGQGTNPYGGYPPNAQPGFPPSTPPGFQAGPPGHRSGGGKVALVIGGVVVLIGVVVLVINLLLGGGNDPAPSSPSASASIPAGSSSEPGVQDLTLPQLAMPATIGDWEYLPISDAQAWYTNPLGSTANMGPVLVGLVNESTLESRGSVLDGVLMLADGRILCGTFEGGPVCLVETAQGTILEFTGSMDNPPMAEVQKIAEGVFAAVG